MRPSAPDPAGPDLADPQGAAPPAERAGGDDRGTRPVARRWLAAAAWVGVGLALFTFFLRISLGSVTNSDGANNALQAWDMLHGNILLHGWVLGDVTFYAFELPLNAFTEFLFGLGNLAFHAASALAYLIVTVCAMALAATGSRGSARAARCAVVVTVLAAPLLTASAVWLLVEVPDHIGSSVFLLAGFLLIDRAPGRRFTAPLLCVILCAGQLSDLTVRYVAVSAIVVVCGYRVLAARKLRCGDAALAAAAAVSVPLESLVGAAMAHMGGFRMPGAPKARLSPVRLWPAHAAVTWLNVRQLFGAIDAPDVRLGAMGAALGLVCLLAAGFGLGRVAWTWRSASRAEQLLSVAIVVNIGIYIVSVMAQANHSHEIAAVLPCAAVLAARACVPARVTRMLVGPAVAAVTALAAFLPLAAAATQPPLRPAQAPLVAWLEAHGLTYGIAGYWDASVVTMQSGNRVQVRTVNMGKNIQVPSYESNTSWYDASRHDATFAIADSRLAYRAAVFERYFGRPAAIYRVAGWQVLIYRTNLLLQIEPLGGWPRPAAAAAERQERPEAQAVTSTTARSV